MLNLGKVIHKVLSDNNINSYPIVAPAKSTLPLVIYERSFNTEYSKDGRGLDSNIIDIFILSEEYTESIDISLQIEEILTSMNGVVLDIIIKNCKLISGAELYQDGVYIQKLTFEIKTAS